MYIRLCYPPVKNTPANTANIFGFTIITITVPLVLKIRDIIFLAGKLLYGPFQGIFRGVKKDLAPSKYPLKWPIN
jgi:hypothetical protein